MARVTFDSIFIRHTDGTLEPRQQIRVGGVTLGPGVRFSNTFFGGVNFSDPQLLGHDLEIQTTSGVVIISGVY